MFTIDVIGAGITGLSQARHIQSTFKKLGIDFTIRIISMDKPSDSIDKLSTVTFLQYKGIQNKGIQIPVADCSYTSIAPAGVGCVFKVPENSDLPALFFASFEQWKAWALDPNIWFVWLIDLFVYANQHEDLYRNKVDDFRFLDPEQQKAAYTTFAFSPRGVVEHLFNAFIAEGGVFEHRELTESELENLKQGQGKADLTLVCTGNHLSEIKSENQYRPAGGILIHFETNIPSGRPKAYMNEHVPVYLIPRPLPDGKCEWSLGSTYDEDVDSYDHQQIMEVALTRINELPVSFPHAPSLDLADAKLITLGYRPGTRQRSPIIDWLSDSVLLIGGVDGQGYVTSFALAQKVFLEIMYRHFNYH